jgi:hypothetical protein
MNDRSLSGIDKGNSIEIKWRTLIRFIGLSMYFLNGRGGGGTQIGKNGKIDMID